MRTDFVFASWQMSLPELTFRTRAVIQPVFATIFKPGGWSGISSQAKTRLVVRAVRLNRICRKRIIVSKNARQQLSYTRNKHIERGLCRLHSNVRKGAL